MKGENNLFNEKTIKRLCSKTKITAKQKKAAKEWLEKLESDSLKREKAHYLQFNDSILKDLLGYDDVKFEEDNVEFSANDSTGKRGICFEVKGTKTKDLFAKQPRANKAHETPVKQLWDYMSKDATPFGIITNYRTFILFDYLKGQSKYHQFDFLEIKDNNDKLKEFISIFSKKSVVEDRFVKKLYDESVIEEKEFTKEFYKLFHETRLMLIEEFKANEELHDELRTPLHFAQLYLNRLMFILFAEDTGKLPSRVFEERILKTLKLGLISDHSRSVSDTIRDLFVSVDKGATTPDKIFGFNGGLFEASIPPKIYFKDLRDKKFFKDVYQHSQLIKEIKLDEDSQKILNKHGNELNPVIKNLLLLASFDFKTDVNVNILGHIFEQSITDIESLQEGEVSRRKKEGVYYTPEHITEYICRNSIIPHLSEKNARTPRELVLEHIDNIEELEKKFQEVKILDPACGSGAFLIKAIDILLEIHKEIQLFKQDKGDYTAIKRKRKVKKDEGQLVLGKFYEEDEARKIIENNIFGVDINEESIEITKLSLFLKIARKNKKLIDLSQNIKCGNSLIEDEEIAEDKAFNWHEEFAEIFNKKEGFDIVIGNPPYGAELSKIEREYIGKKYTSSKSNKNTALIFIELATKTLVNRRGHIGLIVPKSLAYSQMWSPGRDLIRNDLKYIVDTSKAFEDVLLEQIIIILEGDYKKDGYIIHEIPKSQKIGTKVDKRFIDDTKSLIIHSNPNDLEIFKKMNTDCKYLRDISKTSRGLPYQKYITKTKTKYPVTRGANIARYLHRDSDEYLEEKIVERGSSKINFLKQPKIISQRIVAHVTKPQDHIIIMATLDKEGILCVDTVENTILIDDKYSIEFITCLFNSKLISWHAYRYIFSKAIRTMDFDDYYVGKIPIPTKSIDQSPYLELANKMVNLNNQLNKLIDSFLSWIEGYLELNIEEMTLKTKVKEFYNFDWVEYYKILKKSNDFTFIKIDRIDAHDTIKEAFDSKISEIEPLVEQIKETDNLIDQIVYKLYDLTDAEIKVVEENV